MQTFPRKAKNGWLAFTVIYTDGSRAVHYVSDVIPSAMVNRALNTLRSLPNVDAVFYAGMYQPDGMPPRMHVHVIGEIEVFTSGYRTPVWAIPSKTR